MDVLKILADLRAYRLLLIDAIEALRRLHAGRARRGRPRKR